jgi:hypothetical protein
MSDVATKWDWDEGTQTLILNRIQDVEPIIERNKRLQTERQNGDWGRHIATIPNVIIEKWLNEEWNRGNTKLLPFTPEFEAIVDRKLQDPDWKFLRTDSPQVQGFLGFGS